jgi:hypothetical protein
MNYSAVKIEQLDEIWPDFMHFIEDSLEYSNGIWNIEDVEERLFTGNAVLWIAYNGSPRAAGVTWIEEFPQCRDLNMAFAGGDMKSIQGLVKMGEDYAKSEGCQGIRCYGRRGWAKALPGYKEISTISRKEL